MTMRQDETDVNFLDIKPADMQKAAQELQGEISAVRRAWEKVSGEGWRIGNLDCVVIAQKPKLNPHVTAMAQCIAKILDTDAALVSIKPKTNEKLGFEGREEGISTQAAVLLIKD